MSDIPAPLFDEILQAPTFNEAANPQPERRVRPGVPGNHPTRAYRNWPGACRMGRRKLFDAVKAAPAISLLAVAGLGFIQASLRGADSPTLHR
jgi:hypothetical protein